MNTLLFTAVLLILQYEVISSNDVLVSSNLPHKGLDQQTSFRCPTGTFSKKIKWDSGNELTTGIEIFCHLPNSLREETIIRTHGSDSLYNVQECTPGAVRSMDFYWEDDREFVYNITPICDNPGIPTKGLWWTACTGNKAVAGMNLEIENSTGQIKGGGLICEDVGAIETICAPQDKLSVLLVCDASTALYPLKCAQPKTEGYGYTKSYTEELRREQTFYEEFGYVLEYAGSGLSANFHDNLGYSETSGYNWTTTQESTFYQEITITVEVEAEVGCITYIEEIIGDCSFMQVRPNYLQRTDNCSNVVFVTELSIPQNILAGETFYSKVPVQVLEHLKMVEAGNFPDGGIH